MSAILGRPWIIRRLLFSRAGQTERRSGTTGVVPCRKTEHRRVRRSAFPATWRCHPLRRGLSALSVERVRRTSTPARHIIRSRLRYQRLAMANGEGVSDAGSGDQDRAGNHPRDDVGGPFGFGWRAVSVQSIAGRAGLSGNGGRSPLPRPSYT